jgi:hypothetical protein
MLNAGVCEIEGMAEGGDAGARWVSPCLLSSIYRLMSVALAAAHDDPRYKAARPVPSKRRAKVRGLLGIRGVSATSCGEGALCRLG